MRFAGMLWGATLALVLAVLPAAAAIAQPSMDEIRAGAEYTATINRLTDRFYDVIDLSLDLDDVSIAMADGTLATDDGRKQGNAAIAEMQRTFAAVAADAAAAPPLPQVRDPGIAHSLETVRTFLDRMQADAEQAMADSIELFEAALAGDTDIFAAVELRQFDNTIRQLQGENETIATSLVTLPPGTPGHHHYTVIARLNTALIDALTALRPLLRGGAADQAGLDAAQAGVAASRRLIAEARESAAAYAAQLRASAAPPDLGQHNADLILQALDSFDESFDVEAAVADQLDAMIVGLRDPATADPAVYDRTVMRLDQLVDRRMQLVIGRQELLQGLQ